MKRVLNKTRGIESHPTIFGGYGSAYFSRHDLGGWLQFGEGFESAGVFTFEFGDFGEGDFF